MLLKKVLLNSGSSNIPVLEAMLSAWRIDKTLTFKFIFLSTECCKELNINIDSLYLHAIYTSLFLMIVDITPRAVVIFKINF